MINVIGSPSSQEPVDVDIEELLQPTVILKAGVSQNS